MDPVVLDAFLEAHTDDQLRTLIKEATAELESRRDEEASYTALFESAVVTPPPPAAVASPPIIAASQEPVATRHEIIDVSTRRLPTVGARVPKTPSPPPPQPQQEKPEQTILYITDIRECDLPPPPPLDKKDAGIQSLSLQRRMHKTVSIVAKQYTPTKVFVHPSCKWVKLVFAYRSKACEAKATLAAKFDKADVYLAEEANQ